MSKETKYERIHKLIAMSGSVSRRKAEALVATGRVKINGEKAVIGQKCFLTDVITIDDEIITINHKQRRYVYILNKRLGEVCTRKDEQGRTTVFERLPVCPQGRWIMVGRLDINTTGLLIFTNDGDYAESLMHPRYGNERVYVAKIHGVFNEEIKNKLLKGVLLDDGLGQFRRINVTKQHNKQTMVEVVTMSGRNRIVRRLFEAVGCQVAKLHRIQFGPFDLKKTGLL
jgi:23S rRNA pseudouridine2605 synthase